MDQDKVIQNAQYRKGLSIAYFNSLNAAIEIVKVLYPQIPPQDSAGENIRKLITDWQEFFLEKHKNYYATVIANIGATYDSKATIEKLKAATTFEALRSIWLAISEDERTDPEIKKVFLELRKKLKTNA